MDATPLSSLPSQKEREDNGTSEPAKNRIKSRNIFRELSKDTANSLQQPPAREGTSAFTMQSQSPSKTMATGAGVEGVVCAAAVAGKKQVLSSSAAVDEEVQKEKKEEEEPSVFHSGMTGSAVLAKLQQERRGGKERKEEEKRDEEERREQGEKREVGVKEREEEVMMERKNERGKKEGVKNEEGDKEVKKREGDTEEGVKKMEGEKRDEGVKKEEGEMEEEGEKGEPISAIRLRRRNKTVEKPVKTLGIASDPEITPSSTNQVPMVGTFLQHTHHTSLAIL